MATNPVELATAFTRLTRRISGSFSPATWPRARRWRGGGAVSRRCPDRERNSAPLARRWGRAGHPGFFHHRSPPPLGSGLRVRWRLPCHVRTVVVRGWKRLERKSTRRRRGGTTGSGLAAERGIGVQRVEAVPVPAQARDGSHHQSPSCQKTVGFLPSAVVQRSCKILDAAADRTTNTARLPLCPNLQQ